jgi:hypothetical protein
VSIFPQQRQAIMKEAGANRRGTLRKVGKKTRNPKMMGKFPEAELQLYALFKARRNLMRRVSDRWLRANAKRLVMKIYGSDESLGEAAAEFKASLTWRFLFCKRWRIAPRSRTNKKITALAERILRWRAYHRRLRRFFKRQMDDAEKAASGGCLGVVLQRPFGLTVVANTTDAAGASWGLKVAQVEAGGAAAKEGVGPGDVSMRLGDDVVKNLPFAGVSSSML